MPDTSQSKPKVPREAPAVMAGIPEGHPNELLGKESHRLVLAFLLCRENEEVGASGGLLLTDVLSRPLHFAYVSPIRPNKVQRILYGRTLPEHVRVDVIARKLIEGAVKVPSLLFVEEVNLLTVRRLFQIPTVLLNSETPEVSPSDIGREEEVNEAIGTLRKSIDLTEPFRRIEAALQEVIDSVQKDKTA